MDALNLWTPGREHDLDLPKLADIRINDVAGNLYAGNGVDLALWRIEQPGFAGQH